MSRDTVFQLSASNLRFGSGATAEVGFDLKEMEVSRTLVVIDPKLRSLPTGDVVFESLRSSGINYDIFDEVEVEPTDRSFRKVSECARAGGFDSFVAVGGGSTIDTCKAANLFSTYPADFFDYVNAPIGRGLPVPGPLKPLIAIPTTAGTGSETTGTAIFDELDRKVKTGIAHRYLKPSLGIVDSDNTRTMPAEVAASTGLDVLSHALESLTAIPFDARPKPATPADRPAYQGANPVSDMWALHALRMMAENLPRAVADTTDDEARSNMLLAAAIAGIGFGNAGVHLPHAMSYPLAGLVRNFIPAGFEVDHPMIPHGMSVILHTPAVARFTAPASPHRHLQAAEALGVDVADIPAGDAGEVLADRIIQLMRQLGMPGGIAAVGYTAADIPELVAGTLPQHRITKLSPVPAGEQELTALFQDSLKLW
ncbi:MAG: hydroxyacid-oxoacid transhydrogenase [Planctomycetaceae bacterium]